MASWYPIPLLLITVTATILVDERRPPGAPRNIRWLIVWKPLSTLLVILVAALSLIHSGKYDPLYSALIMAGLILSLVGDVLLIIPSPSAFRAGLVAFLCTHLIYIAAFVHVRLTGVLGLPQPHLPAEVITAVALVLIAGAMYLYLKPKLGGMKTPVVLYILVISVMLHRALDVAFTFPGQPAGGLIAFGALLFYASDAVLAVDRFRMGGHMRHGHLWDLSTYYTGQLLIALSASLMI